MTITTSQLDELDATAQRVIELRGTSRDHARLDLGDQAETALQLVAIARAALAWSEARNQDDHDAAAHALRDAVRGTP